MIFRSDLNHKSWYKMGDHPTEETQFVVDEVSNVIKEAIETTIGGNSYTVVTMDIHDDE